MPVFSAKLAIRSACVSAYANRVRASLVIEAMTSTVESSDPIVVDATPLRRFVADGRVCKDCYLTEIFVASAVSGFSVG